MFEFIYHHQKVFFVAAWAFMLIFIALSREKIKEIVVDIYTLPGRIIQHWCNLPEKRDLAAVATSVRENIVRDISTRFVERLPSTISDKLIERILERLPEAQELRAQSTIANLTAQVKLLRKQAQGEAGWVPLIVNLRGYKAYESDAQQYFVLIEYNVSSGKLRAPEKAKQRQIVSDFLLNPSYVREDRHPFYQYGDKRTMLGAPNYTRIPGSMNVALLDAVYTLYE